MANSLALAAWSSDWNLFFVPPCFPAPRSDQQNPLDPATPHPSPRVPTPPIPVYMSTEATKRTIGREHQTKCSCCRGVFFYQPFKNAFKINHGPAKTGGTEGQLCRPAVDGEVQREAQDDWIGFYPLDSDCGHIGTPSQESTLYRSNNS